jgi:drug/metabolite transporter (DMT)-like permease
MILARTLLLFTVIIWGWSFVATKVCLQYMTPLELMGLRMVIALPVLATVIVLKKVRLRFGAHKRGLALGSVIITIHFFIQITGLKYTSATNTGWIISVTPLVMAVLAYFVLKERIGYNTIVGIVVATVGILFLVSKGDLSELGWLSSVGDWLVLASAHTWALFTIATRDVSRSRNPLAVTFAILSPSAAFVLCIMAFTSDWSKFLHLPVNAVVALLFLGLFAMALAHWFWQVGIARVGATEAGIFLYLEPVATTGLAVPYLGERFGIFTAIGGILVLLGVWYAQRGRRKRPLTQTVPGSEP